MSAQPSDRPKRRVRRRVLPGFGLSIGITIAYCALIILLPLAALAWKAASLGPVDFAAVAFSRRALAAYRVTIGSAFVATAFNAAFGLLLAWVLVRYRFPGRRLIDALVDVPFALPTSVAGIALTALFVKNGWFGGPLDALGIKVAFTPLGIMVAMAFTSLPFVVRTVQPVIEELDREIEDAAESLGAGGGVIFRRVILPVIAPAFLAGMSLAFARCLGEFGAIIFIAGNQPMHTEIAALLAFIRLEEYDYQGAAAVAAVMLGMAFAILALTNALQSWQLRYTSRT